MKMADREWKRFDDKTERPFVVLTIPKYIIRKAFDIKPDGKVRLTSSHPRVGH